MSALRRRPVARRQRPHVGLQAGGPVRARPCIEPYGSLPTAGTIGAEHRNDRASWIKSGPIYDRDVELIPRRWIIRGESSHAHVSDPRPRDRRPGDRGGRCLSGHPERDADDLPRHGLGDVTREPSVTVIRRGDRRKDRSTGQTLVEFALVFPLFFTLFLGVIEFAFAFNAILSVNFASRNAALAAAEAGTASGARLRDPERRRGGRVRAGDAQQHRQARDLPGQVQRRRLPARPRRRSGPEPVRRSCTLPDGTSITVDYTRTTNGYPEANRCNILAGCGGTHTTIDHVGVRIFYDHPYVTPLETFVGTGTGITFDRSNVMRMEPIL